MGLLKSEETIKMEEYKSYREFQWKKNWIDRLDWFPFEQWPHQIQRIMWKKHKRNADRLNAMLFFLGNGMDPKIAYTLMHIEDAYDRQAQYQLQKFRDGYLFDKHYEYYDMYEGRKVPMKVTNPHNF